MKKSRTNERPTAGEPTAARWLTAATEGGKKKKKRRQIKTRTMACCYTGCRVDPVPTRPGAQWKGTLKIKMKLPGKRERKKGPAGDKFRITVYREYAFLSSPTRRI